MQSRDRNACGRPGAVDSRVSRRAILAGLTSIAVLDAASATAQVDRRNAQATWNLQRVSATDTTGVILVRIFRGYFPLPDHLVLNASAPPFHFLNFYREYHDDARDGAVVIAKLVEMRRHELMAWVLEQKPRERLLRSGLVIERRNHGPLAPGRPSTRSVVISDNTDFVCAVGPMELFWEPMVTAYGRLPKQA